MSSSKIRRNDPCSCQSGKKYKHCCFARGGAGDIALPVASTEQTHSVTVLLEQGLAKHQAGDLVAAGAIYTELLKLAPAHADALHLLGLIDFQHGDHLAALGQIEAAIHQSQHDPRYFYNLGTVLMALKRPREAAAQFRVATEMDPSYFVAHSNLGVALRETGEFKDSIKSFRAALALAPEDADTWASLCVALIEDDQTELAFDCLKGALRRNPSSAKALNNVGLALQKFGDHPAAASFFARSIELDPLNAQPLINLGSLVFTNPFLDDSELAIHCFRKALEIDPGNSVAFSTYLMTLQYSLRLSPTDIFADHRLFAQTFESPLIAAMAPHQNDRNPDRRLKIGYVSADLYNHAVASFIGPILSSHDHANFEVFCYYNNDKDDSISEQLKSEADHWVPCKAMTDEELATVIAADGIDILIDLGGHSIANRMLTFARKPAPVQVSWIGYPGTTGLTAIDYYMADRHFLPAGQFEDQFSEKIVRLPIAGSFQPFAGAPEVGPLPALRDGVLTFGSFNQPHKFSDDVIALWARLLLAVPTARMLLGGMPADADTEIIAARFAANGIDPSRLQFHRRSTLDGYLALHHEVDLCVDTFPYAGGTTTLHAAWMGVPTLTLAGRTAAGRQGCIVPGHLGLTCFIAVDYEDFVEKGVSWATRHDALAAIRASMRERFADSLIIRPEAVTSAVEEAFRRMWRMYCSGLPAQSFEIEE